MINCTDINSAKEAPPKTRRAEPKPRNNFVLNHGYTALKVQEMMMAAVSMRSNAELTGRSGDSREGPR